jgi:hypothetical protein
MVRRGAECGIPQTRLLRRCVAYLHTPQICGTCRGVKVGIHGLLNWTAENLYLDVTALHPVGVFRQALSLCPLHQTGQCVFSRLYISLPCDGFCSAGAVVLNW